MASLELVVEEPIAGHFYWMIIRSALPGRAPTIIDYARGPLRSRKAAWDAADSVFASYVEAEERPMPARGWWPRRPSMTANSRF